MCSSAFKSKTLDCDVALCNSVRERRTGKSALVLINTTAHKFQGSVCSLFNLNVFTFAITEWASKWTIVNVFERVVLNWLVEIQKWAASLFSLIDSKVKQC